MTPLSFKLVAARLNISNDKGPDLTSVAVMGKGSSQNGWNGIEVVVEGFVISIWRFGTDTGGRMSSSGRVCDSWETATEVIAFSLFCEGVSSDNMGNKEFSVCFINQGRNQFD